MALALVPSCALAELTCGPYDQTGVQNCQVGLRIGPGVTAQQQCEQWCWAACIQAIFALHGHDVDQRAIVRKVFGSEVCAPAVGPQIVYAVAGDWIDSAGKRFSAQADVLWDAGMGFGRPDAAAQAATELANNNPLILGALGHAVVLTAMSYRRDAYGNGQVTEVVIRDPWPTNPNRRVLTAYEVGQTQFLTKVIVN